MATWAYSAEETRHPWFLQNSLKRKHVESSSDDDDARPILNMADATANGGINAMDIGIHNAYTVEEEQDAYPTPPRTATNDGPTMKRRRCDTIERKLARMQIGQDTRARTQSMPGNVQITSTWDGHGAQTTGFPLAPGITKSSSTSSMYSNYSNYSNASLSQSVIEELNPASVFHPSDVQEPSSPEFYSQPGFSANAYAFPKTHTPDLEDVRMKGDGPSTYERAKDCIVITDLDEAIAEAEEDERLARASNPSTSSKNDESEYKSEAEPYFFTDSDAGDEHTPNIHNKLSISELLLKHIKRQANFPYKDPGALPKMQKESELGALVLFRPAVPPPIPENELSQANDVRKREVEKENAQRSVAVNGFGNAGVGTGGPVLVNGGDRMGTPMDEDAMDIEL